MSNVAILFARQDSNYKAMAGTDVFDIDRDARNFEGGMPVVAHPPRATSSSTTSPSASSAPAAPPACEQSEWIAAPSRPRPMQEKQELLMGLLPQRP